MTAIITHIKVVVFFCLGLNFGNPESIRNAKLLTCQGQKLLNIETVEFKYVHRSISCVNSFLMRMVLPVPTCAYLCQDINDIFGQITSVVTLR